MELLILFGLLFFGIGLCCSLSSKWYWCLEPLVFVGLILCIVGLSIMKIQNSERARDCQEIELKLKGEMK